MIETIITTGIGALIGAGVGGAITAKVATAVTKTELKNVIKRVDKHDDALARVIYRDVCNSCKDGKDERHEEVVRRIADLETSFRNCFDDLVSALRGRP